MKQISTITVAWACLLVLVGLARGQDYQIEWYSIDGGGVMNSTGGDFELSGTIGQPDADMMTGGDFGLSGGFWAVQTCPMVPSDFDADCDVDLEDFTIFEAAMNGPNQPPGQPEADLDTDGDCDVSDLEIFAASFTGSS